MPIPKPKIRSFVYTHAATPTARALACTVLLMLGAGAHLGAQAAECADAKPQWLFCEDFEGATFLSQWQEVSHRDRKTREQDRRSVFEGTSSLRLTFPAGDTDGGGWMHHWWTPATTQSDVYMRWYIRYSTGFNYGGWDVKLAGLEGHRPGVRYRPGGAGVRPDGTWYQSRVVSLGVDDDRGPQAAKSPFFYYYHPDQGGNWGDFGYQNRGQNIVLDDDRWYCLEMRIKPNTVTDNGNGTYTSAADGEQTLWIDGVERAFYSGIRWRTYPDVRINDVFQSAWVGQPAATAVQYRWEDNYVVSTARVGCLNASAPARPTGLIVR